MILEMVPVYTLTMYRHTQPQEHKGSRVSTSSSPQTLESGASQALRSRVDLRVGRKDRSDRRSNERLPLFIDRILACCMPGSELEQRPAHRSLNNYTRFSF